RYDNRAGGEIVAVVETYGTKAAQQGKWEAHRLNADIQYVTHGRERVGVAPIDRAKATTPYNSETDLEFFAADGQLIVVEAGSFAIFLPQDVHMPGLRIGESAEKVKKVVVKVR